MLGLQAEEEAGGEVVDVLHADLVAVWSVPQQITWVYSIRAASIFVLYDLIIIPFILQVLSNFESFLGQNHVRIVLYCTVNILTLLCF